MTTVLTPVLPHDASLEGVVLGLAMTDNAAAARIAVDVDGVDFHVHMHQVVYSAILSLCERGLSVDSPSVVAELKSTGDIDRIGGVLGDAISHVRALAMAAPQADNVAEYVAKLRDLSTRRELITRSSEIIASAKDMATDAVRVVDRAAVCFADLSAGRKTQDPISARELVSSEFSALDERAKTHGMIGVSTGYPDIDSITGGLEEQTLTLLAGRPGMGKSALGGALAVNVAKTGVPVLVFSLEMSSAAMFRRMVASEARVSAKRLRRGTLTPEDVSSVTKAFGKLSGLPLHIDEQPGVTEVDIRSRARRHKVHHGLGLVVVDHVQLVRSEYHERNRDTEVGNVSWGLKSLAKELRVPVVALCQLNRSVEARPKNARKPTLSDLRDSGNLEQNADVVLGLYRDDYYDPSSGRKGELDVCVLKNREGETGHAVLRWDAKSVRFTSMQMEMPIT